MKMSLPAKCRLLPASLLVALTLSPLGVVLAASSAGAAPSCKLSPGDYQALAHAVKASLDRAAVDALNGEDARRLCKAREFVRRVRKLAPKGATKLSKEERARIGKRLTTDDFPSGITRFIDDDERVLITPVISYILADAFSGKLVASDKPLPPPPACPLSSLTEEDYASLPRLDAPLTREAAASLSAQDQLNLCLGRRLLRLSKAGDQQALASLTLSDVPRRLQRWVTKEEYAVVAPVVSRILAADAADRAENR